MDLKCARAEVDVGTKILSAMLFIIVTGFINKGLLFAALFPK